MPFLNSYFDTRTKVIYRHLPSIWNQNLNFCMNLKWNENIKQTRPVTIKEVTVSKVVRHYHRCCGSNGSMVRHNYSLLIRGYGSSDSMGRHNNSLLIRGYGSSDSMVMHQHHRGYGSSDSMVRHYHHRGYGSSDSMVRHYHHRGYGSSGSMVRHYNHRDYGSSGSMVRHYCSLSIRGCGFKYHKR